MLIVCIAASYLAFFREKLSFKSGTYTKRGRSFKISFDHRKKASKIPEQTISNFEQSPMKSEKFLMEHQSYRTQEKTNSFIISIDFVLNDAFFVYVTCPTSLHRHGFVLTKCINHF